jgi:hypothetical protein
MTSTRLNAALDELEQLQATVAGLTARLDEQADRPHRRAGAWRRRAGAAAAAGCAALLVVGAAGASPTTSTTSVTFVPLTAPHQVLSASIAANKTASAVVIGGSSTVPADATTVQLTVTAKGTKGGVINFYPAGNVAGASGQTLPYPAGGAVTAATIQENVGQSGELTFANAGAGSATVVAKVIGYSTQVTAGDINGVGGQAGEVLTNNGSGGATWSAAGGSAYAVRGSGSLNRGGATPVTIASVTVPAGSYLVHVDAEIQNSSSNEYIECDAMSPNNAPIAQALADVFPPGVPIASESASGLLTTSGGTLRVECYDFYGNGSGLIRNATLIAYQAAAAQGTDITNAATHAAGTVRRGASPVVP